MVALTQSRREVYLPLQDLRCLLLLVDFVMMMMLARCLGVGNTDNRRQRKTEKRPLILRVFCYGLLFFAVFVLYLFLVLHHNHLHLFFGLYP